MENILKAILAAFCRFEEKLKDIGKDISPEGREIVAIVQTIAFNVDIQNTIILPKNKKRIGYTFSNRSSDLVFLAHDETNCSPDFFTYPIDSMGGVDYIPNRNPYKGRVRIFVNDITGFATITEYSYAD